ncbi:MAG: glycosyltransferase family 2 protein [Oscillospiraceae bacterium]|nr:glycosyltransferase family 2 protein [Oscillospiraceae bacterium]
MAGQPFFTVAIPMYNGEKYIARTIDSVLRQNFDDYEIIVVNDGSKDNGPQVVARYAEKDSRIRMLEKENGGVSSARNCALYNAKGRYIFFLDSDDEMWEDALSNAYKTLSENNFPQLLQTGRVKLLNGKYVYSNIENENYIFAMEGLTKDERAVRVWHEKPMAGSFDIIWSKFIELDFIRENGISFVTTYRAQEDNDFIFKMFRKADTVVFADFVSCCYHKYNENSISSAWSYQAVLSILDRWSSFYFCEVPAMQLSAPYIEMVEKEKRHFIFKVRNGLFKLINQYSPEEAEKILPVIERFFEKEIRKLPYKKERFSYLYPFYKLIGVRRTVYLFRSITRAVRGSK